VARAEIVHMFWKAEVAFDASIKFVKERAIQYKQPFMIHVKDLNVAKKYKRRT